jgi:hypothetical protein
MQGLFIVRIGFIINSLEYIVGRNKKSLDHWTTNPTRDLQNRIIHK